MADNDNTIKRYLKQIEDTKEFAISKFAKELLDVRDNLERANEHIKSIDIENTNDVDELKKQFSQIKTGVEMTHSIMDKTLNKFKVVQYDPKGEKFDPNIHEAVFVIPDKEKENDTVSEVMQTGWKIGDRVLRAAKVGISKK